MLTQEQLETSQKASNLLQTNRPKLKLKLGDLQGTLSDPNQTNTNRDIQSSANLMTKLKKTHKTNHSQNIPTHIQSNLFLMAQIQTWTSSRTKKCTQWLHTNYENNRTRRRPIINLMAIPSGNSSDSPLEPPGIIKGLK